MARRKMKAPTIFLVVGVVGAILSAILLSLNNVYKWNIAGGTFLYLGLFSGSFFGIWLASRDLDSRD